jgi:cardiolipin synthase
VRRQSQACLAALSLGVLVGCAAAAPGAATTATPDTTAAASASPVAVKVTPKPAPAPPPAKLSLLIEPDAGMGEIYALIASARHSVDLTMYELEDTHAEQLLATDAGRGVDVRVILNHAYTSSDNAAAYSYLQGHGVHVRWASSVYALTHQKTLSIDSGVSVVMTLNWTSRYYDDTRDVAVVDSTASDIAAIQSAFNADYDGARENAGAGADLVWSPTTSEDDLLGFINGAHRSLLVENEEMDSTAITDALMVAARRGVNVEICMTNSSDWTSAFRQLTSAGVHLHVYSPDASLYIHAKVLVRDLGMSTQVAFVGSQNFSTESLRYNRELGVTLRSSTLIGQLSTMIQGDYNGAPRWTS